MIELVRIDLEERRKQKMKAEDRVFKFKIKEGAKQKGPTGLVDPRLLTGDNRLHAKLEPFSSLWYVYYEHGRVPPVLQQRWTSFNKLYAFVKNYFDKRNIEIVEVQD